MEPERVEDARPHSVPRLRVGVVGTAHWAREVHAAGAVRARRAELTAVWGRDAQRSAAFAERYGVVAAPSLEELVEQVDVVTFAVPPQVQPGLAVVAARAGRHVLLEKPVATTTSEADAILDAVARGGGAAEVFFTFRFVPDLERALHAATGQRWESARVVWHANSGADDSPYRDSVWRTDPLAALWDLAPHVLSRLLPVLGAVTDVRAVQAGHGVELHTQHVGGAHADISVSLQATTHVDDFRLRRADGSELDLTTGGVDGVEAFAHALDRLIATVQGRKVAQLAPLGLGVEVTRILAQAERSLRRADA